ncbi:MAG: hypothetical protein WD766_07070 [Gemmatimonadota bacterium]
MQFVPDSGSSAGRRRASGARALCCGAALLVAAASSLTHAPRAEAQTAGDPDPQCTATAQGGDVCQLATDLFHFVNPQFGTLIAGGNATLGQGGTLGGLGHFALGLRANVTTQLAVPELDDVEFNEGPPSRNDYTTSDSPGGFPVVDLGVGLYEGYPVGDALVGGVDALVNVFYLPESLTDFDDESISLDGTDTGVKLGYGVRVGLVDEGRLRPGVSVTFIRRSLPTVNVAIIEESDEPGVTVSDSLSLRDFSVQTNAWRLVAGKSFLRVFNVAAGIGRDNYDTGGRLGYRVSSEDDSTISGGFDFAQEVSRTNMFADLSINLFVFRLVGEIGRVSGGDVRTFNQFGTNPNEASIYGAVGLRFGR